MKQYRRIVFIFAVLMCITACSVMNKKNVFKDTRWKGVYDMFVADVGTETITLTLKFVSAKDYVMETQSVMPDHAATYITPDGTVPVLPGWSREYTTKGTYKVASGEVILTEEDGTVYTLPYVDGKLEAAYLFPSDIVVLSREDN